MRIADSRGLKGPGILPLQHQGHLKAGYEVDMRTGILACRVTDRMLDLAHLGAYVLDPDATGDLDGGHNWPNSMRAVSGWRMGPWPAQVTKGGGTRASRGAGGSGSSNGDAAGNALIEVAIEGGARKSDGGPLGGRWVWPKGNDEDGAAQGYGYGGNIGFDWKWPGGHDPARDIGAGYGGKPGFSWKWPNNSVPAKPGENGAAGAEGAQGVQGVAHGMARKGNSFSGMPNAGYGHMPSLDYAPLSYTYPSSGKHMLWPALLEGHFGIVMAATDTDRQIDYFYPTDPRLVAAHQDMPDAGSYVCDVKKKGGYDHTRVARLQSFTRVIKEPDGCIGFPASIEDGDKQENALAWNIGISKCGDTYGGMIVDPAAGGGSGGGDKPGTPTQSAAGGSKPNPYGEGNVPDFPQGDTARSNYGSGPNPDKIVRGYYPGTGKDVGTGRPGEMSGGGGGGGDTDTAVIGCASHYSASGPIDVGSKGDQHVIGADADGHPINSAHISLEAYFRLNDLVDGPLEYNGLYEKANPGKELKTVHFEFDPGVAHDHVCGTKKGKFKWHSYCELYVPDDGKQPPPPPPDTPPPGGGGKKPPVPTGDGTPPGKGGGGHKAPPGENPGNYGYGDEDGWVEKPWPTVGAGIMGAALLPGGIPAGDAYLSQVAIYPATPGYGHSAGRRGAPSVQSQQVGDPPRAFTASSTELAMPVLVGRPQYIGAGYVDFRTWQTPDKAVLTSMDRMAPVTARLEAFGRQREAGQWKYGSTDGRYKHTAAGGFVLLPAEIGMEDYATSFTRPGVTASTAWLVAGSGTKFGAGTINPQTDALLATGYSWYNSGGDLVFDQYTGGVATEAMRLTAARVLSLNGGGLQLTGSDVDLTLLTLTNTSNANSYKSVGQSFEGRGTSGGNIQVGAIYQFYDADAENSYTELWSIYAGGAPLPTFFFSPDKAHQYDNSGVMNNQYSAVAGTATIFNEQNKDIDFIVRGTAEDQLFHIDAAVFSGAGAVGIRHGAPTSALYVNGSFGTVVQAVTSSPITADDGDCTFAVSTAAARTINLPQASTCGGRIYVIKDKTGNAATNNITVTPFAGDTIDNAAGLTVNVNDKSYVLQSDGGTNWMKIACC